MVSLTTCLVAGIHYLIHPQKLGTITATIYPDSILPVTLLTTEEIFGGSLDQVLEGFALIDDVFVPEFGFVLVEKVPGNDTEISEPQDIEPVDVASQLYQLDVSQVSNNLTGLPSGPYILHGPNLYQAWRLYDDEYGAFTSGVIPEDVNEKDQFRALNALSPSGLFKSIPVPSRLYFDAPSPDKPLLGKRYSISDSISLKGVQTTLSSRAWTSLYPSEDIFTAPYAQKLLEKGAVIVGKTKIPHFASGKEWVDTEAPWNPRGDRYQDPAGSSPGAGAALAGYDWLQQAVGEDASGGFLESAARNGVYSLRLAHPHTSLTEVHTDSARFDAIGISSRSVSDLQDAGQSILESTRSSFSTQPAIIYLNDLTTDLPDEQHTRFSQFLTAVENSLGVKAQHIGIEEIWASHPPERSSDEPLQSFLGKALFRTHCRELLFSNTDFQEDYSHRFGRDPFIEATTRFKWAVGRNVTDEQYAKDLDRLDVFRSWFRENVIPENSSTIVVLPSGIAEPVYRFEGADTPEPIESLTWQTLFAVLSNPHAVVPFSQVPYDSQVTGNVEQLPISASIIGSQGSESALIEVIINALGLARQPSWVNTGHIAFPLEDDAERPQDASQSSFTAAKLIDPSLDETPM